MIPNVYKEMIYDWDISEVVIVNEEFKEIGKLTRVGHKQYAYMLSTIKVNSIWT